MIDHVTITVRDLQASKTFYESVLSALGMHVMMGGEEEGFWGFSAGTNPEFEITQGRLFIAQGDESHPAASGVHLAFKVDDSGTVDQFHQKAISAGGTDNGAPGLRPHYGETYYAAFVIDPDGNNIEVCTY